jgi:hypothetical protein
MNLRRPMTLFPEIFDEDSLLHGYGDGKHREDVSELLSSSDFVSNEDWPLDFHITLATTQDLYNSIRAEMQTASDMSARKTCWTNCNSWHRKLRTLDRRISASTDEQPSRNTIGMQISISISIYRSLDHHRCTAGQAITWIL